MSIQKMIIRQRDFSAGEVDETASRRDDTKILKAGLKRARNVRPLTSGSVTRRPGRRIVYFDGGWHDIVRPVADLIFDVTFAADRFTARLRGGAVISDLVAPWGDEIVDELAWEPYGRRIFVTHRTMRPQVVEFDPDAGTWSIYDYEFREDIGGKVKAPFFRFANYGVTMAPSALSGTITLTASAPVFLAGHVGVLFRYAARQVVITAVAGDGLSATAETLEDLPPTFDVTVADEGGFRIGEVIEGDTSGARGEIVDISAGHLFVTMYKGFAGFDDTEIIVGAEGRTTVTTSALDDPGAIVFWDEQFMSDVRGWPGSVSTDSSRLIFCDFAQLENAILWSAITAPDDLDVSGEADGAIFEIVPAVCRVLYVAGGSDEFVLTDTGIYYIPISGDNPLVPGSVEFRRIGSAGAARIKPVPVADGLLFVGETTTRIYAILATGQTSRPYEVRLINPFHQALFNAPVSIAASEGDSDTNPGKAVYVVNGDGTIVVGNGGPQDDFVGWFLWNGAAQALSVAARYGDVIFTVRYALDAGSVDAVERIDNDMMFDGSIPLADFAGSDPLRDSTGDPLQDSTGESLFAAGGALLPFASETMQGWSDGFFLGDVAVDADGRVVIDGTDLENVILGWNFEPIIRPFLETFEGGSDAGQRLRRRKIAKALVSVKDSQTFEVNGRIFGSYRQGEDWGAAPPLRTDVYPLRVLGRGHDPDIEIRQPTPGAFTLLELTTQLTI